MNKCNKCKKKINFSKSFEVFYGKIDYKEKHGKEIVWSCTSGFTLKLCPKCYKEFIKWFGA